MDNKLREKIKQLNISHVYAMIATLYVIYIMGVMPLVLRDGYYYIAESKMYTTYVVTIVAVLLCLLTFVCNFIFTCINKKSVSCISRNPLVRLHDTLCATDICMTIWIILCLVSTLMSSNVDYAMEGSLGWKMGLYTYLTMFVSYCIIRVAGRRLYIAVATCAIGILNAIMAVIGILDRFSIYILDIDINSRTSDMLSTIGNIDWLCGFLSIIIPLGFWITISAKRSVRIATFPVMIIVTALSAVQGADAIIIIWGITVVGCLLYALDGGQLLARGIIFTGIIGSVTCIMSAITYITRYTYYGYNTEHVMYRIGISPVTLIVSALLIAIGIILCKKNVSILPKKVVLIRKIVVAACAVVVILYFVIAVVNTRTKLAIIADNQFFLLNDAWGNGRGGILGASTDIIRSADIKNLLFGAGPDCFAIRISELPKVEEYIANQYAATLSNAHCLPLTQIVLFGIPGAIAYFAVPVSCILENKSKAYCVVPLLAYFAYGLLSFDTVVNYPLMIVLTAICMSLQKRNNNETD